MRAEIRINIPDKPRFHTQRIRICWGLPLRELELALGRPPAEPLDWTKPSLNPALNANICGVIINGSALPGIPASVQPNTPQLHRAGKGAGSPLSKKNSWNAFEISRSRRRHQRRENELGNGSPSHAGDQGAWSRARGLHADRQCVSAGCGGHGQGQKSYGKVRMSLLPWPGSHRARPQQEQLTFVPLW